MSETVMTRTVTADIDLDVTAPGRVVFQVAVVRAPGLTVDETLSTDRRRRAGAVPRK